MNFASPYGPRNGGRAPGNNYIISPPTTEMSLVFPFDRKNYQFDRSFYAPALTDGRLSNHQIECFLNELERAVKKKLVAIKRATVGFAIFLVLGFLGFVCLLSGDDSSNYNFDSDSSDSDYDYYSYSDDLDWLMIYMFSYFFIMIVGALFIQLYTNRRHKKARRAAQSIVDKNAPMFAVQGLRWNIPLAFPYWVELWKDYRGQSMYSSHILMQPYNMPVITNQVGNMQSQHVIAQAVPNQGIYPSLPPLYHNVMNYRQNVGYQRVQDQEDDQYVPPTVNSRNQ